MTGYHGVLRRAVSRGLEESRGVSQGLAGSRGAAQGFAGPREISWGLVGCHMISRDLAASRGVALGLAGSRGASRGFMWSRRMSWDIAGSRGVSLGLAGPRGALWGLAEGSRWCGGVSQGSGVSQGLAGPHKALRMLASSGPGGTTGRSFALSRGVNFGMKAARQEPLAIAQPDFNVGPQSVRGASIHLAQARNATLPSFRVPPFRLRQHSLPSLGIHHRVRLRTPKLVSHNGLCGLLPDASSRAHGGALSKRAEGGRLPVFGGAGSGDVLRATPRSIPAEPSSGPPSPTRHIGANACAPASSRRKFLKFARS